MLELQMKWSPLDWIQVVIESDWIKTFHWLFYSIEYQVYGGVWVLDGKLSQEQHLPKNYITQ